MQVGPKKLAGWSVAKVTSPGLVTPQKILPTLRSLKPWYGVSVPSEVTIADIYSEFSSGIIGKEKALESEYDGFKVI